MCKKPLNYVKKYIQWLNMPLKDILSCFQINNNKYQYLKNLNYET